MVRTDKTKWHQAIVSERYIDATSSFNRVLAIKRRENKFLFHWTSKKNMHNHKKNKYQRHVTVAQSGLHVLPQSSGYFSLRMAQKPYAFCMRQSSR